jgi:hypothetical protein
VERQRKLLEIRQAACPPARLASGLHSRQQERHEHADNGDHDEQFHQREALGRAKAW